MKHNGMSSINYTSPTPQCIQLFSTTCSENHGGKHRNGSLYCICLHNPSYADTKLVYGTRTASCSSFQIIFKAVAENLT